MELDSITGLLRPWPVLLSGFRRSMTELTSREDMAIAVGGSLARGTVDRFSDLDFAVLAAPGTDPGPLCSWVAGRLGAIGRRLSQFPANHIGLPNLIVTFCEIDGEVVKVDCMVLPQGAIGQLAGYRVIHDPSGIATGTPGSDATAEPIDEAELDEKFTGWCWYSFTKIARGELMEATDALDVMRRNVLVPVLRHRRGLKAEGFRWLEDLLSSDDLASLHRTYPGVPGRHGLVAALAAQMTLYRTLRAADAPAALDRMADLLAREPLWRQSMEGAP
ncbi:nucleotidyltransferase domain-containing protein [Azospirillum sp. B506]|uniref:nucleotidyltransferase domain-containing protein n=1 Tax=Azospirillum sp. B506 TaxID=137721 RepID=UPI00131ED84F|nr:nucleotidyltransferase domain-containing protein [Azospirillum sp. B506]